MKQDEIKTDSQQGDAFYKALRENFTHTTDPYQDLAGYALNDFIGKYINHLLSKKPSVSDEEIRKYANGNFGFDSDSTNLEHAFCSGAEWMRDKLSPQVVQSEVSEEIEYWKSENSRLVKQLENQKKTIRNYQEVVHVHFPEIYADSENLNDEIDRLKIELNILKSYHSKTLTPPDAEAVMFAEWIYKNYISNGIGKYYHNNWNGDLDTLVNYTTQELFTLYKQGGK